MTKFEEDIIKKFNDEVYGISMNEYSIEGDTIRPIMVVREDALKFLLSALAQQRELLQTECCMGGCANINCEHCKLTNLITAKADK